MFSNIPWIFPDALGPANRSLHRFEQAIAEIKEGVAIAKEGRHAACDRHLGELCPSLAACCTTMCEYSEALPEMENARRISRSLGIRRDCGGRA